MNHHSNYITRREALAGLLAVPSVFAQTRAAFAPASKKAFVCDLDGTLFLGNRPIAPAIRFIAENAGRYTFYYLTNNTSKTPDACLKKLRGAGIVVVEENILTPLVTLEAYIREKGYASVYIVANDVVQRHLGARMPEVRFEYAPGRNQLVALTFDTEVTYEKLRRAAVLLNADPKLDYVATHGDKCCPSEEGPIPDIGGLIALIQTTNGREPTHIFGKPSPSLLAPVLERFAHAEIAMVGDRLYTDKAMADNAGVDFVCVLSGETTRESLKAYTGTPPSVVVETLGDLH
jgi:HAD superfamily hydrolase (TIGR01450 family)